MTGVWWWSWLLAAVGVTGLYLAGSKRKAGWVIGIAVQSLWIAYAVHTRQWGFIVSALAFGWVNTRNLIKWHREERDARARPESAEEVRRAFEEAGLTTAGKVEALIAEGRDDPTRFPPLPYPPPEPLNEADHALALKYSYLPKDAPTFHVQEPGHDGPCTPDCLNQEGSK
jgi:hypothetical protein